MDERTPESRAGSAQELRLLVRKNEQLHVAMELRRRTLARAALTNRKAVCVGYCICTISRIGALLWKRWLYINASSRRCRKSKRSKTLHSRGLSRRGRRNCTRGLRIWCTPPSLICIQTICTPQSPGRTRALRTVTAGRRGASASSGRWSYPVHCCAARPASLPKKHAAESASSACFSR